jgi:hypothetical protein
MPYTNSLDAHALLQWLAGCDSRDEMHNVIRGWLQANPRPPTPEERQTSIFQRVDSMLAGAYQVYGDPRPALAARDSLLPIAETIVGQLADPAILSPRIWLEEWLTTPAPGLSGRCPEDLLNSSDGVDQVRALLQRESGT